MNTQEKIQEHLDALEKMKLSNAVFQELKAMPGQFAELAHNLQSGEAGTNAWTRNFVFINFPQGTDGKIANWLAKVCFDFALLQTEEVLVIDSSDLFSQFIGQTAKKIIDAFDKAKGKVLLLQNAELFDKSATKMMSANEAPESLSYRLGKYLSPMVILSGPEDEMQRFLRVYPLIHSRFDKIIVNKVQQINNFTDFEG